MDKHILLVLWKHSYNLIEFDLLFVSYIVVKALLDCPITFLCINISQLITFLFLFLFLLL